MKGVCAYLWGKFSQQVGNTYAAVSNVALTTNVATVTLQIITGPLPVVGSLISIINTTTSTGLFNVNRAVITGVTINTSTNAGTITFALTNANVGSAADAGSIFIEPAEVGETIVNNSFSIACVIQAPEGDSQFTVPFSVTCPTIPTALTATLQRALKNSSNEWTNTTAVVTIAAGAFTAGPVIEIASERAYLYRVALTGLTGTGTVVAKIGG